VKAAGGGAAQAADSVPLPELGKADTRWLRAVDPFFFLQRGKADTRSGKGTGSAACGPLSAPRQTH
jgi:hypothetical protein